MVSSSSSSSSSETNGSGGERDSSMVGLSSDNTQVQSASEDPEWGLEGREYTIGLLEIPWTTKMHANERTRLGEAGAESEARGEGGNRTYRARSASGLVYC